MSELEFVDGESGRIPFADKASFKSIVMNTVMRLGYYYAVEFRGGLWVRRRGGDEYYLDNTREVVFNEVEYLWILLEPHLDSETIKKRDVRYEEIQAEIERLAAQREKARENEAEKVELDEQYRRIRLDGAHFTFRLVSQWLKDANYLEGVSGVDSL